MAHEALERVAKEMPALEKNVADAKELIAALKEAGETPTDLESELVKLELRLVKWNRMLAGRGL